MEKKGEYLYLIVEGGAAKLLRVVGHTSPLQCSIISLLIILAGAIRPMRASTRTDRDIALNSKDTFGDVSQKRAISCLASQPRRRPLGLLFFQHF